MKSFTMRTVATMMVALAGLLPLAGCGGDEGESCQVDSCSGNGTCDDSTGAILCTCTAGYAGDRCDTCASGHQDNDQNGTCLPDCSSAQLECSQHAQCDDASGVAVCACEEGYRGDTCSTCDLDYQDYDGNGTCEPKCEIAQIDCNQPVGGDCDDESGTPTCVCRTGYLGDDCTTCDTGYQDNDGDHSCLEDCATANPDCGDHGACDDSDGLADCACDTGYTGTVCDSCDSGYQDNDHDGECAPDCLTASLDCGHGACDDSLGVAVCVCDAGYTGDDCSGCDAGYQDNDGDGTCLPDCSSGAVDCHLHGDCDDSSGQALCACFPEYAGESCDSCSAGHQDNDQNGTCHPTCATAQLACVHGQCEDTSGIAECVCDAGYAGDLCDSCTGGYQDNDQNGTCEPTCAKAIADGLIDCQVHGHCEDDTGTAVCVCDAGYQGANCDQCMAGYQDNDGNGTCLPTCATAGWDVSCQPEGVCDDSAGQAGCLCTPPFVHDGAGHCVNPTGYTCAEAIPLDLAAGATGSTVGTGDDYHPTAGCYVSQDADDVVYSFNVVQDIHARFSVVGFDTVMYLRSECENASSEIACADEGAPNHGSMFDVDLSPGTYYLFIDGWYGATGDYTITVEVSCPPGQVYYPVDGECIDDPCVDPNPCTAPNQTVCQVVLPDGYNCHCDPGYIDDPGNPGTCIVDPNPHGESCADMIPLPGDEGTLDDSTLDAVNDGTGADCGWWGPAGDGPDRVYGFVLDQQKRVQIDVSGYDLVVYLRTVCDDMGSEVVCVDDYGNSEQIITNLAAGAYYLWIDSYSSGGDYTLSWSFRTNPCADEESVCPGTPVCVASGDWSSYECVCPAGTLPWGNDCVDDPCDPNPCVEPVVPPHKNRCVQDLPDAYFCECNIGYIDDGQGGCMEDPNANEWAFIVWLNADSNLDPAGVDDVAEMGVAGSTPYVHIVAQWDSESSNNGDSLRIYVTQGGYDVVDNLGDIDSGDWQNMRDFGVWAVQNYPARHYAFIMWDHGAGWDRKAGNQAPVMKGFSYDYTSGNNISVANGDYAQALAGITAAVGDKLDIVGHDECLMQMWEVAEASAPYARDLVASEETEPFDGWAYDLFLPQLINDHTMTPLDLGIAIVEAYYTADSGNETLSVVDLETMNAMNAALSVFADTLAMHPELNSQISSARNSSQSFADWDFIDLYDFAIRVSTISGAPQEVVDAANALMAQMDITIAHNRSQGSCSDAQGMAIYFPESSVDPAYTSASWSQACTWDDFISAFNQ